MTQISPAKLAFIASLVEHPKVDDYIKRAFLADNLDKLHEDLSSNNRSITKADFLSAKDDEGRLMISLPNAWKNFSKIIDFLAKNNETLTTGDFLQPIDGDRTLIKLAEQNGGLSAIFNKSVWVGQMDAEKSIDALWHATSVPERNKLMPSGVLSLKREVLQEQGKVPREDQLAAAGVDWLDITSLFEKKDRFEEICAKLEAVGDKLRKSDLLMRDHQGDTVFFHASTWENFEKLSNYLKKTGQPMGVDDYTDKPGRNHSPLLCANERSAVHKIFEPALWVGRVDEMLKLWTHVAPAPRKQVNDWRNFEETVADVEDRTYAPRFKKEGGYSLEKLITPINPESATPIVALGLKSTWENFGTVQSALREQGEEITMDHLRLKSGAQQNTCLMVAAKTGHFEKVISVSAKGGASGLGLADFLTVNRQVGQGEGDGVSLLRILSDRKELSFAFDPRLWVGKTREMEDLWQSVTPEAKLQVDFADAYSKATRLTVNKDVPKFTLKGKKP